MGKPHIIW